MDWRSSSKRGAGIDDLAAWREPAVSLSLRSKLLLGFALVAAVPLIAIEQVAARLFRREFETRTARAFEASLRLVQTQFQREGERVTAAMEDAAQSFALRDALLAYAASSEGAAQSELIRTIGRTAAA